jgi:hypothetical protein
MGRTLPAGSLPNVTDPHAIGDTPDDGPTTLRLAVLILWVEAVALVVLTVIEMFALFTLRAESRGWSVAMVVTLAVAAALAAALGRWLAHRRRWARSPAIVLQLMALPVAFFMLTGPGAVAVKAGGVLLAAVALVGAGLLLAPGSRAALTIR